MSPISAVSCSSTRTGARKASGPGFPARRRPERDIGAWTASRARPFLRQGEASMRSAIAVIGALAFAASARASLVGSADLVGTPAGGGLTHYSGVVHNTGTTTIGTFWYAWLDVPLEDFMPHVPQNITAPPGWFGIVQGGGVQGYSIEYYTLNAASYVPAGQSLSGFGFDSLDTVAVMNSPAPTDPHYLVATSVLYIGFPQGDPGFRIVAT